MFDSFMQVARFLAFVLTVSLGTVASAQPAAGQTASQPAPSTPQAPVSTQQRPRTSTAGRPALAVEVTNPAGDPLGDVKVTVTGPLDRAGTTNAAGTVRFANLRAGTYRARFDREGFIRFEREVTLRMSGVVEVDVVLNEAPAPPPPPAPAVPVAPPEAPRPVGEFSTTDVPNFVERNFIGRSDPVKITPLGCTGYATSRLIQLRDPLENQVHADADEAFYVVAGEAALRVEGRGEQVLAAGSFTTVPRGTKYGLTRRGRNPPIIVSVLSGPACEGAR